MTAGIGHHRSRDVSSDLVTFTRPAPDYRLAFVALPRFLEAGLNKAMPDDFRTAPPLHFRNDDFHRPFLGADELTAVNRFRALKKQVEWMAGRYAAKALARQVWAEAPEPETLRVDYRPQGAPFFTTHPFRSLSISHARDYAVAGMGCQPACVLGLDLEFIRPAARRLLLKTGFSDREAADLQLRDDATLFKRWTAKEAYLKFIGLGFNESLKKVEIINDTVRHRGRVVPSLTLHSSRPLPGYAFSIVFTT
jgi:4'-phosphopantetheinyl transferase